MASRKQYADVHVYEKKLAKVMERFGIEEEKYNYDFSRREAWGQFAYRGEQYRFTLDIQKAEDLAYGSDCFSRIVLALEDLARMVERGIYDLSTWVSGMRMLPEPAKIPEPFIKLGFTTMPGSIEEVKESFRSLLKIHHPDQGGSEENLAGIMDAYRMALSLMSK